MQRVYMDKQGRVTIPRHIRWQLGLDAETSFRVDVESRALVLRLERPCRFSEDKERDAEALVRGDTLNPAERRRILYRLAG